LARRALARRHAVPPSRIETLLEEAIRQLLGADAVPQLRRAVIAWQVALVCALLPSARSGELAGSRL